MVANTRRSGCFIFSSKFDAEIYRYLITNHRDDVQKLRAEAMEQIKEDVKESRSHRNLDLAERMDWPLRGLLADQCPIETSSFDVDVVFANCDIFTNLMTDAIGRCDFIQIARAYLAGVELPPAEKNEYHHEPIVEGAEPTSLAKPAARVA
jgi:hypothetical protein